MKSAIVLALRGTPKVGKSSSIRMAYEKLYERYSDTFILEEELHGGTKDIGKIVKIKNIKIGIENKGDEKAFILNSISIFKKMECDIILCAVRATNKSRSKDAETVMAIKSLEPEYRISWFQKEKASLPEDISLQENENRDMAEFLFAELQKHIP